MKIYLRILSVLYAVGALLHYLDLVGLRLDFAEMSMAWKAWIIFLAVADTVAAVGLWKTKTYGVVTFLVVAISQLIAYVGFSDFFGNQTFLIGFHVATLVVFVAILVRQRFLVNKDQTGLG